MSEVLSNKKLRYHNKAHHFSNWCSICHLYYCWHPECKDHKQDERANHIFIPMKRDFEHIDIITEFLTWLKWYKNKGFQVHKSLDKEIEKWEKRII